MRFDPRTLAEAAGGELVRGGSKMISGAFIDSRSPRRGALFVPIVARRDGHAFVDDAIAGGAAGVLIAKGHSLPKGDVTLVRVDDTLAALTRLGRFARSRITGPVVAITGSNGKTTTRAMVEAVLQARFARVLCTRGNLNNHLGVPLTLLDEPHEPEAAVIELGMSAPGENDHLARIVKPTVGIITSIALEHLEFMGSIEAIAAAEAEVVPHLPADGALVVPSDERLLDRHLPRKEQPQVLRVGPGADADVRVESVEVGPPTRATLVAGEDRARVELQVFGAHNARNAASAAAVGQHVGLTMAQVADALAKVRPVGDRGRVLESGPHLIVADCYNANPGSMRAALESLAGMRSSRLGPLVAVLGDMLELGPESERLHAQVGTLAGELGVDAVLGYGASGAALADAARAAGSRAHHVVDDPAAAADWVREALGRPHGGAVLIKGSRGMALERVVELLSE